ncbi:D-alanyl-D-alanine carboxypeptidase [Candidatus Hepatincolaceae symbiont of Richtersius coronifer]
MKPLLVKTVMGIIFVIFFYYTSNKEAYSEVKYNFITKATQAIVTDESGTLILFAKNPYDSFHPASITKLMLLYIAFEKLEKGELNLATQTKVSKNAFDKGNYRTGGSSLFLLLNQTVSIETLIKGISVASGNDASITLAEIIAGNESTFVNYMNQKAKILGMQNTNFANVDGFNNNNHYSTAFDIALLANRIRIDFPQYYYLFKDKEITFNNIKQWNRNLLLFNDLSNNVVVDGLKTGHHSLSKYSLAFSAITESEDTKNYAMRVTGVVSGLNSHQERYQESAKLLRWVYNNYRNQLFYKKDEIIKSIKVNNGKKSAIKLIAAENLNIITPKKLNLNRAKLTLSYNGNLEAPIKIGDHIGTLTFISPDSTYNKIYKIVAQENIERKNKVLLFILSPYYAIKKAIKNLSNTN